MSLRYGKKPVFPLKKTKVNAISKVALLFHKILKTFPLKFLLESKQNYAI
jgi:hypothetical protein